MLAAHGYTVWDPAHWNPGPLWRLPPLVGLCLAMLLRRTAPLTGLAIATPMSLLDVVLGPGLATTLIFTDSLYTAALYGSRRGAGRLLSATVVVMLGLGTGVGLWLWSWRAAVLTTGVAGITWVGPVLTAMVVRGHRDRADLERQRAGQLAKLAELDRRNAADAERARMARELHDVIANHLSAVALHSSAVLRLPGLDAAQVRESIEVIRENSVQGLAEMRRMIGLLRAGEAGAGMPSDAGGQTATGVPGAPAAPRESSELDDAVLPRLDQVRWLVERTARPDLGASLEVVGEPPGLPAAIELGAYRIVQESLTNALKHAGPGMAAVRIEHLPGLLRLTVTTPLGRPATGTAADTADAGDRADRADEAGAREGGAGLVGMRERVSILGGTFHAGPDAPRAVWTVRAVLPTEPPAPASRPRTGGTARGPTRAAGPAAHVTAETTG